MFKGVKTFEIKTKNIVCGTFNMNHIDFLKSKMPTLSVALMTKSIINIETLPDITSNMDYLVIHWESLDEKTIEYFHINEMPVITYTLKNDMQFKYIQKYDIDGIISQYRLFPSSGGYEKIAI
jgi:glycerophosphoryl diester phosphodiesterase